MRHCGDLEDYIDDIGWQEWMNEYVADSDYPTEEEFERIDRMLEEIWNEVAEELKPYEDALIEYAWETNPWRKDR